MKFDLTPSIHVHPPCYYSEKVYALFVTILTGFHLYWQLSPVPTKSSHITLVPPKFKLSFVSVLSECVQNNSDCV